MSVRFDHIEVHVNDIEKYCLFLEALFEGGAYKVISSSGTSMFTSPEGLNIEIKKRGIESLPVMSGFCNPCLRRLNAKDFIAELGIKIDKELAAPSGMVYFFKDYEGVVWHIKDMPA